MDFFTSDWHLNDELIREKCNRQFKNAARMNDVFIQRANARAHKSDVIIHVGDFIQRGMDRGTGLDRDKQIKAAEALEKLEANVILLQGNHDENNRCNTAAKMLIRKVSGIDCIVQHYPSNVSGAFGIDINKYYTTVNICGHVHKAWAFFHDKDRNVLNVNVGIDIYPNMIKEHDLFCKISKYASLNNLKIRRFLPQP